MPVTLHNEDDEAPHPAIPQGQTASQRIVGAANSLNYVEDLQGRRIGWRRLDALDEFDLSELAGAQNSANPKWMMFAMVAFAVKEIDGKVMARPGTRNDLRARVKLLGADGLNAVMMQIMPQQDDNLDADGDPVEPGEAEAAPDPMERAKNSQGTPR